MRLKITNSDDLKSLKNDEFASPYYWSDNKSDLVEVVESIIHIGGINSGRVNKDEFYEFIGKMLNVDLSNHSRILYHISERKDYNDKVNSRVHYLPQLIKVLSGRLNELERERSLRR